MQCFQIFKIKKPICGVFVVGGIVSQLRPINAVCIDVAKWAMSIKVS